MILSDKKNPQNSLWGFSIFGFILGFWGFEGWLGLMIIFKALES